MNVVLIALAGWVLLPPAASAEPQPPPAILPPPVVSAPAESLLPPPQQKSPPEKRNHFAEALASAYAGDPLLKAQREVVKAADEGVAQAISGFRPNISAEYERSRERANDSNQRWGYGTGNAKGITVTQDVFNGGESLASYEGAHERVHAARAKLIDIEQQVLFQTVVAYTDVVEKKLVLKLNQNNVDVLQKQLDATQARFEVGDVTRTDVSQSEARLSQARADERQALGDYETSRVSFRRSVGYDPPEDIDLPPLPPGMPPTLEEASNAAQAANPTLGTAQSLEKAAGADIDTHAAALLPDVSVRGTMSRGDGAIASSGSRNADSDALTLNVSIPLYQSGAEWSRLREAKNQEQQAKFITSDTRDAVIENVTRAWHDYHTARAIIVSTQEAAGAAQLALEGVRQENEAGTRTILDVLNAEQEAFSARVGLVQAQTTEKAQAYRLLAAVGKLTIKDLAIPADIYDPKEHYNAVKYQLIGF